MKKQENQLKRTVIMMVSFVVLSFGVAFGADILSQVLTNQSSSGTGSNSSVVTVSYGVGGDSEYINAGNNSSVIGNYFKGYYYDSVYGYFELDWSTTDLDQNVRIVGSTAECGTSYGYKVGGYARSEDFGFVDFDYSDTVFVYYCLGDNELHGYAYSEMLGFQNFEGIGFEVVTEGETEAIITTQTGTFRNDTTGVTGSGHGVGNGIFLPHTVGGDVIEFKDTRESIFYIIK